MTGYLISGPFITFIALCENDIEFMIKLICDDQFEDEVDFTCTKIELDIKETK